MIYLKNIGLWCFKHVCIVLAVLAALWLWEQYRSYKKESVVTQVIPQVKEVKEIHHYHETPNTQPITVLAQFKIDSSFRKMMEKETINTGVKIEPGKIGLQSVDSVGNVIEKDYKIPEGAKVTIDNKGVNIEKASFLSQLKVYGGGELGVNQNGLTNVSPQIILTSPTGWALNGSYNIMDNSKNIGVAKRISFKRK
jgi:hypothetical protein